MQAIKEKWSDMNEMRKVKAEAKEEEKAEKEMARARLQVAHEVRMAKEAEAAKDLHVSKAAEKAAVQERKHPQSGSTRQEYDDMSHNPNSPPVGYTTDPTIAGVARPVGQNPHGGGGGSHDQRYKRQDSLGRNPNSPPVGFSNDQMHGGAAVDPYAANYGGRRSGSIDTTGTAGTEYYVDARSTM